MSSEDNSPSPRRIPSRNPSPPPAEMLGEGVDLHADNIGDTAYSKHWFFTTLMNLIQEVEKKEQTEVRKGGEEEAGAAGIDIDEELENELCKLWDMSINKDVGRFLQEFHAVDILMGVINKSQAPRVTEICVGILGNMACCDEICRDISNNEKLVDVILGLLEDPDAPTLVETSRLIHTCVSNKDVRTNWLTPMKRDSTVYTAILFMLQSSTNVDLLHNLSSLLDLVLDVDEELLVAWAMPDFVQGLHEAIKQTGEEKELTVDSYLHCLQLLSTTENGVQALVECTGVLFPRLTAHVARVCGEDVIAVGGRERSLASAMSVLNVLFSSAGEEGLVLLEKNSCCVECVMQLFEVIQEDRRTSMTLAAAGASQKSTPVSTPHSTRHRTEEKSESDVNGTGRRTCAEGSPRTDTSQSQETEASGSEDHGKSQDTVPVVRNLMEVHMLYSVTVEFLADIVKALPKGESQVAGYLNGCTRDQIESMVLALQDHTDDTLIPHLEEVLSGSEDKYPRLAAAIGMDAS
ncbi:SAAL1 [Branchiostoma lanceolatum]|uniref:SAAL1 protein n=1 Tax=Branchiostoma lanceolatum TaxID=7740 RepID=A0A8K0EK98_BRALA|nr:SAAL1 [Branchiostoma lanceolatum]